jgi:transcriptional regulator with XRE-family HTH domain
MTLARRIREEREKCGLTLDELAEKAGISKTYLWELENDKKGTKKPSADVLLRIAKALSLTIADLLSLPVVKTDSEKVDLNNSLVDFRDWMKKIGEPLSDNDLKDLATMRFRGGQPRTKDDWDDLYRTLKRTTE